MPLKKHNKVRRDKVPRKQDDAEDVPESEEVEMLKEKIQETAVPSGSQISSKSTLFSSLPLSNLTQQGLALRNLTCATEIQAATLPHALLGRDILGAAKTGSGKTLAFVIPILERLFVERWTLEDGLGALIITPTRELALQIFDVLRAIGKKHQFSAGLITGGKKEFEEEQARVVTMNILVATPGRLLQHMEQTPGFDLSRILTLVLDEADRILDMGFKHQLDSIMEYLPTERQTLLFSATQTRSVKDLARLSLHSPEYIAVHSGEVEATPSRLKQNFVICPLEEKLNALFSFIKSHLKTKMIVFMSSCSQVKFAYECFRGLQPGISLLALHGKIKQEKRTIIYMDYLKRKHACLLATDIAARGLDFPDIDWVVQLDAPEDASMYIHRVGRTARYTSAGRALLFLMPQEEKAVLDELRESNIPLQKLSMNPNHVVSVTMKAAALLVAQPECRSLAKKAFTAYLRSIQLQHKRRDIDITRLNIDGFSSSLGLSFAPPLPPPPFVKSTGDDGEEVVVGDVKEKKNVNRSLDRLKKQIKEAKLEKKRAREEASEKNNSKLGGKSDKTSVGSGKKSSGSEVDHDEDDELFVFKKSSEISVEEDRSEIDMNPAKKIRFADEEEAVGLSLSKLNKGKKKVVKIGIDGETATSRKQGVVKMTYNEDGSIVESFLKNALESGEVPIRKKELEDTMLSHASKIKRKIDESRHEDNLREKERIKEKRVALKQKERSAKDARSGDKAAPVLSNFLEENASDSDENEDRGNNDENDYDHHHDEDGNSVSVSSEDDISNQERLALQLMSKRS